MQVPPRSLRSTKATLHLRSASRCDSGFPACPEPITIASNLGMAESQSGVGVESR